MSKLSIARNGKTKKRNNQTMALVYGNLFLVDGMVTGWLNLHVEGCKPVRVKVLGLDADNPDLELATRLTGTIRLPGAGDDYRYITAELATIGDEVVTNGGDEAGITAAALKRNHRAPQPVDGKGGGWLASLMGGIVAK